MKSQHLNETRPPDLPSEQQKFPPSVMEKMKYLEREADLFAAKQSRQNGVYPGMDQTSRLMNENETLRYQIHAFSAYGDYTNKVRIGDDVINGTYRAAMEAEARTEKLQEGCSSLDGYVKQTDEFVKLFETYLRELQAEGHALQRVAELLHAGMQLHEGDGTFCSGSAEGMTTEYTVNGNNYKFVLPKKLQGVQTCLPLFKIWAKTL